MSEEGRDGQTAREANAFGPYGEQHLPAQGGLELPDITTHTALRDCVVVVLCLLCAWLGVREWLWRHGSCADASDYLRVWLLPNLVFSALATGLALFLTMGEHWNSRALGLRPDTIESQVLWGIGGAVASYAACLLLLGAEWSLHDLLWRTGVAEWPWARVTQDPDRAWSDQPMGMALAIVAAAAAIEETAFRGLLLPRLRRITGSWWSGVAICSLLFGLWHISGGFFRVLSTALTSIPISIVFIRSRSLLAAALAHGLYNMLHLRLGAWWLPEE